MGLFESLGVKAEDLPEAGFSEPKDGFHNFEITEVSTRNGSKNNPNTTFIVIAYDLDEAGNKQEWYGIAVDGEADLKGLSRLARRLRDLGEDPDTFEPDDETLVGVTGSFELVTTTANNGKKYQNIRNIDLSDDGDDDDTAEQDAAIKRKVAANRAAREAEVAPAKKAPARRTAKPKPATDEDDENPFE